MRVKPGLFPPSPEYVVGANYVFTYNGHRYSYKAHHDHLEALLGPNRSILIAVFGDKWPAELEKIYGYRLERGAVPTWRFDDHTAGQRVFDALIERGVEIIPK